jgi:hypothetical protein
MDRFLVSSIGGLPREFRARLSTPRVQAILADYEKHGGDPALLRGLLYQLFNTFDPTTTNIPRSFKTMLQRCKRNLALLPKCNLELKGVK